MSAGRPRRLGSVLFGAIVVGVLIYMFLFATAASIEIVMLLAVAGLVLWFATVDAGRLIGNHRQPNWRLFGLAALGLALLVSAMVALGTGTMMLTMGLGFIGLIVGAVRAIRFGLNTGR